MDYARLVRERLDGEQRGQGFVTTLRAIAAGLVLWAVVLVVLVVGAQSFFGPTDTRAVIDQEPEVPVLACLDLRAKTDRNATEDALFRANCAQPPVTPTPQTDDAPAVPPVQTQVQNRQDCTAIRGTQYRSGEERDWFFANCSSVPGAQSQTGENRSNCDQIRGTAYRSDAERQWYLTNCPNTPPAQPQPTGQNRMNCAQIEGTPYLSGQEQSWYLANCLSQPAQPQVPQPQAAPLPQLDTGGDRRNCDLIYGTPFRSSSEAAWFFANCPF